MVRSIASSLQAPIILLRYIYNTRTLKDRKAVIDTQKSQAMYGKDRKTDNRNYTSRNWKYKNKTISITSISLHLWKSRWKLRNPYSIRDFCKSNAYKPDRSDSKYSS